MDTISKGMKTIAVRSAGKVTISQESYDDYRKATAVYFYLTNHWLVRLAVKLRIIKLGDR